VETGVARLGDISLIGLLFEKKWAHDGHCSL